MIPKCVVLDYREGKIHIIDVDMMQDFEDIKQLLTEDFGFQLSEIAWMVTTRLKIDFGPDY